MAVTGFTKLIIATDEPNEHFEIDGLPPGSYSVGKKVNWKEGKARGLGIPTVQWEGGARSLGLSVVFDTYEDGGDVRDKTKQLAKLAEAVNRKGKRSPPVCTVFWGADAPADSAYAGLPFNGVVESLTQKFTMFDAEGTPVRATVDVQFREVEAPATQLKKNPGRASPLPARSRIVKEGDSLWAIAHDEYGDARKWRDIARANLIINPRRLEPGAVLLLPETD